MSEVRAGLIRERAECRAHLADFKKSVGDQALPWRFRYEAAVMIDVCNETLADIEEALALLSKV